MQKQQMPIALYQAKKEEQKQQKDEKELEKGQQQFEEIDVELNQFGRPKQKVIFYSLTEEMKEQALQKIQKDDKYLSEEQYKKAQENGKRTWDKFYQYHKCNFFKDRTYLERECREITDFKELFENDKIVSQYYELGCGVGNTLFPLIKQYKCFKFWGCDISAKAISMIDQEIQKRQQLQGRLKVAVCDLVKDPIPFQKTGDLVSLIFVMSAIVPEKHNFVIEKIVEWMKPGAFLYFRDYGRYDFGQLNLSNKGNRKLKDNFYVKNDGVCVYYFEQEQLEKMCVQAGLKIISCQYHCKLLQNRKTGLKMYRVWLQGRFYKPPIDKYFQQKIQLRAKAKQQQRQKRQNQQKEEQKRENKQTVKQQNQEGQKEMDKKQ